MLNKDIGASFLSTPRLKSLSRCQLIITFNICRGWARLKYLLLHFISGQFHRIFISTYFGVEVEIIREEKKFIFGLMNDSILAKKSPAADLFLFDPHFLFAEHLIHEINDDARLAGWLAVKSSVLCRRRVVINILLLAEEVWVLSAGKEEAKTPSCCFVVVVVVVGYSRTGCYQVANSSV